MNDILLVGAGPMAVEYGRVLSALSLPYDVVGRGPESARKFQELTGKAVQVGGLAERLAHDTSAPVHAIVAVGELRLGEVSRLLIQRGVKSLLVEKPGAATVSEIRDLASMARDAGARVFVAYNRRFYASVLRAAEMIQEDGGVTSFSFEFTEWSHVIRDLPKEPGVKENWYLHNSTHVVDLAFYLGGRPAELASFFAGGIDWHPAASVYAGAGRTDRGALFSYQANWEAPGRWVVEMLTKKRRLIFKPMEKLQVQRLGSVAVEFQDIDDHLDTEFKPGIYRQVQAFLGEAKAGLCTLEEQAEMLDIYGRIGNY